MKKRSKKLESNSTRNWYDLTKNIDNEQEYFILNDLSDSLFITKIVSLLKP